MFNFIKSLTAYCSDNPNLVNVTIEIPKGSKIKYEYSEDGTYLTAVRAMNPKYAYIYNYGFVCGTLGGDNDPLDAIILYDEPFTPGTILKCKVVGVITTIDKGEEDDKILCIPYFDKPQKINIKKILKYLNNYKYPYQEGTYIKKVLGSQEAHKLIKEAVIKFKGELQ